MRIIVIKKQFLPWPHWTSFFPLISSKVSTIFFSMSIPVVFCLQEVKRRQSCYPFHQLLLAFFFHWKFDKITFYELHSSLILDHHCLISPLQQFPGPFFINSCVLLWLDNPYCFFFTLTNILFCRHYFISLSQGTQYTNSTTSAKYTNTSVNKSLKCSVIFTQT